jgi:hypothetical protein
MTRTEAPALHLRERVSSRLFSSSASLKKRPAACRPAAVSPLREVWEETPGVCRLCVASEVRFSKIGESRGRLRQCRCCTEIKTASNKRPHFQPVVCGPLSSGCFHKSAHLRTAPMGAEHRAESHASHRICASVISGRCPEEDVRQHCRRVRDRTHRQS